MNDFPKTAVIRAAAIFTAAFNAVYDEDDWLTIGVDNGTGAEVNVTGSLYDGAIRFDPADVVMLLDFLTRVLAKDESRYNPYGIVAVTVPNGDGEPNAWAWHLLHMTPLTHDQSRSWLGGEVRYNDGLTLAPDQVRSPDNTAVTEEVREILRARGLTARRLPEHPMEDPDHDCGTCSADHRPIVPPMVGIGPYCACGWTPRNGYSIHDHLKDQGAWPPAPIEHSPRGHFGPRP
ncbi:hypothetical protein AQJ11_03060 [Streptomyces corchorusii]|uniref:Uncharacterized protein n=2 Tax=Streptomyces TaxID=1883 RepID=A0A101QMF1_STRCK|nr:hypothetical protein [Streptomyces corchorusii]KUN32520.1 hypothetical protein AQJ11_03060 [Streptomyces corchorusii]